MTSVLHSQLKKEAVNTYSLPTLKFIGAGVLWIVLSDLALFLTQTTASTHYPIFHLEVAKGILFVFAMGIYFFITQRKNEYRQHEVADLELFKENSQPMLIYNPETMEILEVNDAATQVYGYSKDEFLAMKISDLRPAEDLAALKNTVEQLRNGLRLAGHSKHLHKNKTTIHTEVSVYSIPYKKFHAGLIIVNDISNQIRAEQALIEMTKIHEKQMNDKLYEVALFNKELHVRIREVNANNEDLIEINKLLQQASSRSVARYDAKLQRLQSLTRSLVNESSDILWVIDLNDPKTTLISNGALSFFSCSRKYFLDRPNFWETFVSAQDRQQVEVALLALNTKDEVVIDYLHKDGHTEISQQIRFIRDDDGHVEKIVFLLSTSKSLHNDFKNLSQNLMVQ
jgi:PAS domain S-box-containing protein